MGRILSRLGRTDAEVASLLGMPEESLRGILESPDVGAPALLRVCRALRVSPAFPGGDVAGGTRPVGPVRSACGPGSFDIRGKVAALLRERHGSMCDLCRHVGVHRDGMRRILARDNCGIGTLVKVASYFGVPVTHFLPVDPRAAMDAEKDMEIQYLRGQLRGYQAVLATLSRGR